MAGLRLRRYGPGARVYDVLSGERWVYRVGRLAGIDQLRLSIGDSVLDIGCGTGLDFPVLMDAVGPGGSITGVDSSDAMLRQARSRTSRAGWSHVRLVQADAGELPDALGDQSFDAALFTYSLSIIADWQAAFTAALSAVRPGGRIGVVDMALPTGGWRVLSPLARLACLTGGADPHRHPWTLVPEHTDDVTSHVLRGGHIHAVAGTHREVA